MRVLLVEDDAMIGGAVQAALRDESCAVDWLRDGKAVAHLLSSQHYDMVLLDLGLPGKDGLEVLADLRSQHIAVPLLVISARDTLDDKVRGLDTGADDYVLKPFEMRELLARMRAVVRRKGGSGQPELSNGQIRLDPVTHEAVVGNASPVLLTHREFALLQALMIRPGAILSRGELEERIYGWDREIESNVVEFLIHALRKKLGSDVIKNVRGAGWMVARAQ